MNDTFIINTISINIKYYNKILKDKIRRYKKILLFLTIFNTILINSTINQNDLNNLKEDYIYYYQTKKDSKICIKCNCNVVACYNYKNYKDFKFKKGLYCKDHKLDNMIDVAHSKCIKCNKTRAGFNYEGEKSPTHCGECAPSDMVDVTSKKCIECNKIIATFNYEGEKSPTHCGKCAPDDMIDVKSKKCIECKKTIATFNYEGEKSPTHCGKCAPDDMIDVKRRKCIKCNKTRAGFNYEGEESPTHCGKCASDNMVNVTSRKCIECNKTRAGFNYEGDKTPTHCGKCAPSDMVDVTSRKCIECNKTKAGFNYKGEKLPTHCGKCAPSDMVDIIHKQRIYCNMIRADKKYKNHCFGCYCFKFPEAVVVKNHKTKENQIASDLLKVFSNIIRDATISGGCSKRRPDILLKLTDYNIVIEIDENQHLGKGYDCENKRLMEIFQDLGNSPLTIIRFNPDKYDKEKGLFSITKSTGVLKIDNQKRYDERLKVLINTIQHNIDNIPNKEVNIVKLYYNSELETLMENLNI